MLKNGDFKQKGFRSFSLKINKELKTLILKVNVSFADLFVKPSTNKTAFNFFSTKNNTIDYSTNFKIWYQENVLGKILVKLEEFQELDSSWSLLKILYLKVSINKYNPINAGNFSTYIDLPEFIKRTKSVINIKNNDVFCFLYSIMAALYPVSEGRNPYRISSYPDFRQKLNFKNIDFPIALKDIPKFEVMNSLTINIFTILNDKKKQEIVPLILSKSNFTPRINLLMLACENGESDFQNNNNNLPRFHFAYIKKFSRLMNHQVGNINNRKWYCERCLNHFSSALILEKHIVYCKDLNNCKIMLPKEPTNILYFKNIQNSHLVPFVIYADIESILVDCVSNNTDGVAKLIKQS